MIRAVLTAVLCFVAVDALNAGVISGQTDVDGRSNIFGAGLSTPPGDAPGILPPFISIPDAAIYVDFSATGAVSFDINTPGIRPYYGPDGGTFAPGGAPGLTNIYSEGGISGLQFDRNTFLAGVFLSDSPTNVAPDRLNLHDGSFLELSPELQQTFFIGDGLTGTGSGQVQRFYVPDGATRLFFGLVDGFGPNSLTIAGPPRFYNDNGGSYLVEYAITVPEPSSLAIFGLGALGLMGSAICRRKT